MPACDLTEPERVKVMLRGPILDERYTRLLMARSGLNLETFVLFTKATPSRTQVMPEISRFLGIVITMYFNDHNPPHFHVRYEDFRAIVGIDPLELREGHLPPRVLGLVMEWAEIHQAELSENWTTLAAEGKFRRIAPLV